MRKSSLYISYGGIADPLIQTQVVAYLEGLARAGYRPILLTFEQQRMSEAQAAAWRQRLRQRGVIWHRLRYHKSPTVPATAWDILTGVITGLRLARRYRVSLLHARAHIPAIMALLIKRLTGLKLLFDIRGLNAEESVDSGAWPADGLLYRTLKWVERRLMDADGYVVLTERGRLLLERWYPREMAGKPLEIIPCCVDLRQAPAPERKPADAIRLVYSGKLGGWYMLEEMVDFVRVAATELPDLRWQIFTQSDTGELRKLIASRDLSERVSIGQCTPDELAAALPSYHAGLALVRPAPSKVASSPTKVGEYLAAGLPVVSSSGIGDLDKLLGGSGAGILLRDFSPPAYAEAVAKLRTLLADPATAARCRALAEQQLSLTKIGWPRYQRIYERLIGKGGRVQP